MQSVTSSRTGFRPGSRDGHPLVRLRRRQQVVDTRRPAVVRQDVVAVVCRPVVMALRRRPHAAGARLIRAVDGQAAGEVRRRVSRPPTDVSRCAHRSPRRRRFSRADVSTSGQLVRRTTSASRRRRHQRRFVVELRGIVVRRSVVTAGTVYSHVLQQRRRNVVVTAQQNVEYDRSSSSSVKTIATSTIQRKK